VEDQARSAGGCAVWREMMKKIVAYCGVNSETNSTYLLLKESFHSLSKDNQINTLNELIQEFQHQLDFIKEYTQDTSIGHQ
jgi:hypothetical protein